LALERFAHANKGVRNLDFEYLGKSGISDSKSYYCYHLMVHKALNQLNKIAKMSAPELAIGEKIETVFVILLNYSLREKIFKLFLPNIPLPIMPTCFSRTMTHIPNS
jgi:hypothetical protein